MDIRNPVKILIVRNLLYEIVLNDTIVQKIFFLIFLYIKYYILNIIY